MAISHRIGPNIRFAPFCAIACVILGVFFLGLGGLRLYSLSLENHLSQLSQRVEKASEELAYLQMQQASYFSSENLWNSPDNSGNDSSRLRGSCARSYRISPRPRG